MGDPSLAGLGEEVVPPGRVDPAAPLAVRMRPATLDEVLGQDHLLGPGAPLRRLVEGGAPSSILLFGPPGTGKTTLARLVAGGTGRLFVQLSALSAGVKEVRGVIAAARARLRSTGEQTVLFIDEVHRFSKTQQDSLLAAVEDRTVIFIGATTENPFFSVISPLLSRSLVLQLKPLDRDALSALLDRALVDPRGLGGRLRLADAAREHLLALGGGDARRALTALEAAADSVTGDHIELAAVEGALDRAAVRYDRDGDQHYDIISAYIKSIRGSDVDAALHYLARMIDAGEDARFIARRLLVHASEDIGMADPSALTAAVNAAQVVQFVGLPEARIALAQATIHLACAPKSNAVIGAIDAALADVRSGKGGLVPPHLRDGHYSGAAKLGHAQQYIYPPGQPDSIAHQQYPPDELIGRNYYEPQGRGVEKALVDRVGLLRRRIRGQEDI